jgi:hypothetical protein
MKTFLFLCLINILISQKSEWQKDFNQKSLSFFTEYYFSDDLNQHLPFNQNDLDYFLKSLLEKKSEYNQDDLETANMLFRYYLSLDQEENAYKAGYLSFNISGNKDDTFYKYIRAYYQLFADKFSFWTHLRHAFSGIKNEAKSSKRIIREGLNDNHPYKLISLFDALIIHEGEYRNYRFEVELCRTIINRNDHEKKVLSFIAKKSFELGDFETAISTYSTLNILLKNKEERSKNYYKIAESYYHLGLFKVSKQYLINFKLLSDSLNKVESFVLLSRNDLRLNLIHEIDSDTIKNYLVRNYAYQLDQDIIDQITEKVIETKNDIHLLDYYLNRENLVLAERSLNDSVLLKDKEYIRLYYTAKFYWKKKDYFNSKRNLHNLIHDNSLDGNPKLKSYANLILADILIHASEKEKARNYIDEVNPKHLMFYDKILYQSVSFAAKD